MLVVTDDHRVVIKKDWQPERIGQAHLDRPHQVCEAEEFAQGIMAPPKLRKLREVQPVVDTGTVDSLVKFLNR